MFRIEDTESSLDWDQNQLDCAETGGWGLDMFDGFRGHEYVRDGAFLEFPYTHGRRTVTWATRDHFGVGLEEFPVAREAFTTVAAGNYFEPASCDTDYVYQGRSRHDSGAFAPAVIRPTNAGSDVSQFFRRHSRSVPAKPLRWIRPQSTNSR